MLLDGRKFQDEYFEFAKKEVKGKIIRNAIIIVGDRKDSETYVRNKVNAANKIGILTTVIRLDSTTSQEELLNIIKNLNNDNNFTGILIQFPLPKHIDENVIAKSVNPLKDLDCFNPINIGNMFLGNMEPMKDILPCTPLGIINLLDFYNIDVSGKDIVVVGRSNIVGKPLSTMLINKGATVTTCNSKTKELKKKTKNADIIILATGKACFFDKSWFRKPRLLKKDNKVTIVDVGINVINERLYGDFDKKKNPYNKISKHYNITPVPNGVGRATIAGLIANSFACWHKQQDLD